MLKTIMLFQMFATNKILAINKVLITNKVSCIKSDNKSIEKLIKLETGKLSKSRKTKS